MSAAQHVQGFIVKENSWIAKIAAMKLHGQRMAIVIGKTVHLHNTTSESFLKDDNWVRHELVHLRQFRQYGFIRFIILYLVESVRHGYYNNKFEVEARAAETSVQS